MEHITSLPGDVIGEIGRALQLDEIKALSKTCSLFAELFKKEAFWLIWYRYHIPLTHDSSVIKQITGSNPWLYYTGLRYVKPFDTVIKTSVGSNLMIMEGPDMISATTMYDRITDTRRRIIRLCISNAKSGAGVLKVYYLGIEIKYIGIPENTRFVSLKGVGKHQHKIGVYAITEKGKVCVLTPIRTNNRTTYIHVTELECCKNLEVVDMTVLVHTFYLLGKTGRLYLGRVLASGAIALKIVSEGPYLSISSVFMIIPSDTTHLLCICGLIDLNGMAKIIFFHENKIIYENTIITPKRANSSPMITQSSSIDIFVSTEEKGRNLYVSHACTMKDLKSLVRSDYVTSEARRYSLKGPKNERIDRLVGQGSLSPRESFQGPFITSRGAFITSGESWMISPLERVTQEGGMDDYFLVGGERDFRYAIKR